MLSWDDVYKIWCSSTWYMGKELEHTLKPLLCHAELSGINSLFHEPFLGYDWFENDEAENRKVLTEERVISLIRNNEYGRKGTKLTAELLSTVKTPEDRAAVWIASTSHEFLMEDRCKFGKVARLLHEAAYKHLEKDYEVWHYAMRGLVPCIMVPESILGHVNCPTPNDLMDLIVVNSLLLMQTHKIVYSTMEEK